MVQMTEREFLQIRDIVHQMSGISLSQKKKQLVVSRLSQRLRVLGFSSFSEYLDYLTCEDPDSLEAEELINRMSTNKTDFFREAHHFSFLTEEVLPSLEREKLRIWSTGCSSGEEPYSICIALLEYQRKTGHSFDLELLASDISTDILQKAANGIYKRESISPLENFLQKRYFLQGKGTQEGMVRVKKTIRSSVTFKWINLMDEVFPFAKDIDVIFMRNVLIYFDKETKYRVVRSMQDYLRSGGYLFLGHSESLYNINADLEAIGKTVYRKPLIEG